MTVVVNYGRDLPYFLSLTSLAAAMEVAEAIGREHRAAESPQAAAARSAVAV